jgi:hypothetical protein
MHKVHMHMPSGCPTWVCRGLRPVKDANALLIFILVLHIRFDFLKIALHFYNIIYL